MQNKVKAEQKVCSPDEWVRRLNRECCAGGLKTSSFYWGLWTRVVSLRKLGYMSSTPRG